MLKSPNPVVQVAVLPLIQQTVNVCLRSATIRLTFLTASMAAFVTYTCYVGDLTAMMTHRPTTHKIRNFQVIKLHF